MSPFFKNGIGTSAYRNNWNVLDQIHVSSSLLNKENKGWLFWKANIFNKPFLINKEGRYKGYPFMYRNPLIHHKMDYNPHTRILGYSSY